MKKTILALGLLVATISCNKADTTPTEPTPVPVVKKDCEIKGTGNIFINNESTDGFYCYVNNVQTKLDLAPKDFLSIDIYKGAWTIKLVNKNDDTDVRTEDYVFIGCDNYTLNVTQ